MSPRWLIFFLLVGGHSALLAQGNRDSLWRVWTDTTQVDTHRLNALHDLSWQYMFNHPDTAHLLAEESRVLAARTGWRKWEAKALNTIGATYQLRGEFAKAVSFYERCLPIFQELGVRKGESSVLNNLGLIFRTQGNLSEALEYYLKCLAIAEEMNDQDGLAMAYNNIGTVYSDQENFGQGLIYFKKALVLYEKSGNKASMSVSYNNIGSIYKQQEEYLLSQEYYERSLNIRLELNDLQGQALVYNNLGLIAKEQGKFDSARQYHVKALALQDKIEERPGQASSYYFIGDVATEVGAFKEAISWCKKSLVLSQELGAIRTERNACHCLFRAYKEQKQFPQALEYFQQYVTLRDSLLNDEANRKLEQMEFARIILSDSLARQEEKLRMDIAYQKEVKGKSRLLNILLFVAIAILLVALIFHKRMAHLRQDSRFFQNKAELLEKQHLLNEIALLRTQVNPHFLFNSLSILSSLVRVDPGLSEKFIDQLSKSYRYILEQKELSLVALRTEMEFIQSYIFLLKIRFEQKFDVHFNIREEDLDRYQIPPLTLQLLIENAMKHNRMSVQEPLIINVTLTEEAVLEVSNPLQPRHSPANSTGIGLQNIITRYGLLTDKPVRAGERDHAFVVEIPLIDRES